MKKRKIKKEGGIIKKYNNYSNNKKMQNNNFNNILFVTEIDKEIFKLIKKELKNKLNKNNKIEYINLNYLNKKIKYYNLVFLINSNLEEIKKLNKIINFIKLKYFVKKERINILFIDNNSIDLEILKKVFKKYNVLGKIKFNNKEIFNKKIINKMKGMKS